jgi:hypothetical protein
MATNLQDYLNYFILVAILLGVAFLYHRYKNKLQRESLSENYNAIRKYLLNDVDDEVKDGKLKKPIMWIHIDYEYNARNWLSFGSRSSLELNQPYLYLTANSIIKHCEKDFHICFIDDEAFYKLLPGWKVDMSRISGIIKENMRNLAMVKLLYTYGGIRVPLSFVCMRNLIGLYKSGTNGDSAFICELVDRNVTSSEFNFYPSIAFMGAKKGCIVLNELIDFMQRTISSDYTDQSKFLGDFDRWCNARIQRGQIKLVEGKLIGTKTMDNEQIIVDDLLSNEYIDLYSNAYGIYIPANEVLKRRNYEWFARMSPEQVLESTIIISKYILLANAPDAPAGVIEPLKQKEDWVSFWRVPSGAPVWGLKPIDLGNNVPRQSYPGQQ